MEFWCFGDTNEFKVQATTEFDRIVNYTWDFGDGSGDFVTLDTMVEHPYGAHGLYDVSVIVLDDRACRDTFSLDVQLCDVPEFSFVYSDSCNSTATLLDFTD